MHPPTGPAHALQCQQWLLPTPRAAGGRRRRRRRHPLRHIPDAAARQPTPSRVSSPIRLRVGVLPVTLCVRPVLARGAQDHAASSMVKSTATQRFEPPHHRQRRFDGEVVAS